MRIAAALLFALSAAAIAQPDGSALERAYADVVAARAVLQRAEAARTAGEEPLEGERLGVVTPSGKRQRSRLTDAYWERQKQLDAEVARAQKRLDEALQRWNALK